MHSISKTKKFNKSIVATYGENNISEFKKIKPKNFSFENVVDSLNLTDPNDINRLYVSYVSKIFGYVPKNKSLPAIVLNNLAKEFAIA